MAELVMSRVFHTVPNLKVAYSEGGIGWFPYAIMRMDQVWEHYRYYNLERTINADVRPSDLVREHIYGCFIDDPVGIANRDFIGLDNILWESDYPHADSLFPHSRKNAERVFESVPDADVRKMVETNARRLFRI
jgi:predicted TIM-barrel fold metal-dependent hydrolase